MHAAHWRQQGCSNGGSRCCRASPLCPLLAFPHASRRGHARLEPHKIKAMLPRKPALILLAFPHASGRGHAHTSSGRASRCCASSRLCRESARAKPDPGANALLSSPGCFASSSTDVALANFSSSMPSCSAAPGCIVHRHKLHAPMVRCQVLEQASAHRDAMAASSGQQRCRAGYLQSMQA